MHQVDHSARRSNRLLAGMLVVSALLALALVGLTALTYLNDGDGHTVTADLPPGVVAIIDGIEVTEAEWLVEVTSAEYQLERTRGQVAAGLEDYPGTPAMYARKVETLPVLETAPPEVHALAELLGTRATAAEAYAQGLGLDAAQAAERAAEQREHAEAFLAGEVAPIDPSGVLAAGPDIDAVDDPGNADPGPVVRIIEVVGEEPYWNDVIPAMLSTLHASQALFEREIGNRVPDGHEQWQDYRLGLARAADVELHPDLAGRASIDAALGYLDRQRALPVRLQ